MSDVEPSSCWTRDSSLPLTLSLLSHDDGCVFAMTSQSAIALERSLWVGEADETVWKSRAYGQVEVII